MMCTVAEFEPFETQNSQDEIENFLCNDRYWLSHLGSVSTQNHLI